MRKEACQETYVWAVDDRGGGARERMRTMVVGLLSCLVVASPAMAVDHHRHYVE